MSMGNPTETNKILAATGDAEAIALLAKVGISVATLAVGAPGLDIVAAGLIEAFRPSWTKRQTEFASSIVERLAALEINVQKLTEESEHFVTVFGQATREAISTHEKEKIEA